MKLGKVNENVIEWEIGDEYACVTFPKGKLANKVRRLKAKFPDLVEIIAENRDGSIYAHIPISAIKLSITEKRELSPEEREAKRIAFLARTGKLPTDEVTDDDFDDEDDE